MMSERAAIISSLAVVIGFSLVISAFILRSNDKHRIWNVQDLNASHLSPPDTSVEVKFAPEEFYYGLPEHVIYETYPVYAREFEPRGYLDSLKRLKPKQAINFSDIVNTEDWIAAGRLVFNWPMAYSPVKDSVSSISVKDFEGSSSKLTREGIYAFNRYVIMEDGKLMKGSLSCASCHTRITSDKKLIEGAQGNLFNNAQLIAAIRSGKVPFPALADGTRRLYFTPWAPDIYEMVASSPEEFIKTLTEAGTGTAHRQGGSYLLPLKVPSLFGIKDIRYLDHSGLMKHNSPGDLMRYAALNQGMDMLTSYNGFIPGGTNNNSELPSVSDWRHPFGYAPRRYSDEQLFALAQYIYSLTPPANPDKPQKEQLVRGQVIFKQEGCVTCHTPPLYTNNKLTPVNGFEPGREDFSKLDIFNVSVGTDSSNALYTRRGTGYYKVPSLRNIWLQQAFLHNGNVASLEELFDPDRTIRATNRIKGHPFGLTLKDDDKAALITFLKSL